MPDALSATQMYNAHLSADAAIYGVLVADLYTAFGGPAAPNPKLCTLTYMCGSPPDEHPTADGHTLIAAVLIATAGL